MSKKKKTTSADDNRVRTQYEAYPYPARNPRDEAKRLIAGSPGHLLELNHFVFAGRRNFAKPFRALIAGGGTGDGTIMLAQQLADAGCPAEILYIDLSDAAREVAEARARARKLKTISFRRLSILDVPGADLGVFDYIDCCGVLHHLEDPAEGLKALVSVLAEDGGMGLMLYGELGRTGVYAAQDMLRALTAPDAEPAGKVDVAKRLLKQLPPTNWLRRNPFLADHLQGGESGIYDLLLHSRDRAYRVPEVAALAEAAGLRITAFVEPAAYDPASYLVDQQLLSRLDGLGWLERCAFAELLAGNLRKHIFYAVKTANPGPSVADPADMDAVPVFRDAAEAALRDKVGPGGVLSANLGGVSFRFPVPPLAGAILARVDGEQTIGKIRAELQAANPNLDDAAFADQFGRLYKALNGLGKLFLAAAAPSPGKRRKAKR